MKKKFFRVDFIRVTTAFLVILLHTSGLNLGEWNKVAFRVWMTQNMYDAFTRMSVPIFIMLSGALLLNREETYSDFFKKRISKILIPFIVWIGVYLCWRVFYLNEDMGIKEAVKIIIKGPVYYHLWYLYMLVGLYLITPIVRKITNNSTEKDLLYFIGLWVIFIAIIPTTCSILKIRFNISLEVGITVPMLTGHIGYYIIGNYLNHKKYTKTHMKLSWIGLIGSWLFISLGTWYFTDYKGGFNDVFYSYFSPTVVLEAICGFILLSYYGGKFEDRVSRKSKDIFSKLGDATLGVYLVHPLILDLLVKGDLNFPTSMFISSPIISILLATFEVMIISYVIILILLRIPILRYTVGESNIRSNNSFFPLEKKI